LENKLADPFQVAIKLGLATPIDTKSNGAFAICISFNKLPIALLLVDGQGWIYQCALGSNTGTKRY